MTVNPIHFFTLLTTLLTSTFLLAGEFITKNFLYVQGMIPEKKLETMQVKIGCWNICGTHLSQTYGGVVHWQYRLPGILEKVRASDPDVMVFQEVYDSEVTDLLIEGLKDRYAHLFVHLGPNPEGAEGGCMILSKYPVHTFTNTSFKNNSPSLNRSFATLEIKASEKDTQPSLRIIGTHILYGYDDVTKEKREAQIEQIKEHIRSLISCPTLIAADFNTERNDPSLSFLEHGYKGEAATCMTTPLIRQWDSSASGPEQEWIDNISLVKGSEGTIQAYLIQAFDPEDLDSKTALSDHHFLVGEYIHKQLPYAPENLLFQSADAIKTACHAMLASIPPELDRFARLSSEKDYDSAYRAWSNLLFRFFSLGLEIGQTITLSADESIKECARNELTSMNESLQKILSSSALSNPFVLNAHDAEKLSPQQRQITSAILMELENREREEALQILAQYPKASYSEQIGLANPLKSDALTELKILTANIVCFPDALPYLYGGVRPWKMRIDKLVDVILDHNADVVCLQEVWDPEAMQSLMDKLKDSYAFFIYNAGDPAGTMNVNKIGYNSGLFIASKLPFQSSDFLRFPRSIPQGSNRGVLAATLEAGGQRVTLFNTHLQHGDTPEQVAIRKEQLLFCYEHLRAIASPPHSMAILVGDLNINAFLPECAESGLSHLFSIPYIANLTDVASKATCSNYFNDLVITPLDQRNKIQPTYELLDYCILPADSSPKEPKQVLIPLAFPDHPSDSLSDHHALLTTWPFMWQVMHKFSTEP